MSEPVVGASQPPVDVAIVDASAAVGLSLPFLSLCLPRSWSRSTWLAASRRDAQP
jgi:hypothetical protein